MSTHPIVPFLDLLTPHRQLEEAFVAVFKRALATAGFIGGPMVDGFEREFADFCGTCHSVGVASGTDALRFALIAAGVQPGDVVVTVPNTFIATAEAISQAGATPAFVDVDERTFTMDPERLRSYLERDCSRDPSTRKTTTRRTGAIVRAVVPVHLFGQMADMDAIGEIAAEHDLIVVEDACQAHGAEYFSKAQSRWRRAGTIGAAAAFSFYPGKNLGACGEAGAITTDDDRIDACCRMLRDHGQSRKYVHEMEGYNGRLDAIQAGILRVKLERLAAWNAQRQTCAAVYADLLQDCPGVTLPYVPDWSRPVYHLFVVRVAGRDAVQQSLTAAGVGTGIHYPIPLHLTTAYVRLGHGPGAFPVAERAAGEVLSLPMFPHLSPGSQRYVAEQLAHSVAAVPVRA